MGGAHWTGYLTKADIFSPLAAVSYTPLPPSFCETFRDWEQPQI